MTDVQTSLPTRRDVPETLLTYDQWLCWRVQDRDGKPTKIPIDPNSGGFASTNDPETWASFETARGRAQSDSLAGLGFVFTVDDPVVGVDLDDCRDPETGELVDRAASIVETLESYTEISPSRTGVHVLVIGELPGDWNRSGDLEIYETARFFTVTGDHFVGTPTELRERTRALETVTSEFLAPEDSTESSNSDAASPTIACQLDDEELLRRARNAANGEKFARLWRGDTSGYESHSEADMALCSLLAFWTGGDSRQIDRLFRDSGLMREKWDETHFADGSTYGEKTIERAISGTDEFYEPPSGEDHEREAALSSRDSDGRQRVDGRLGRIDELRQRLAYVLKENDRLRQELADERAKREELEGRLEADGTEERSLFSWW